MSDYLVYLLTIEGLANSDGQIRACYPCVPDYAAASGEYIAGALADAPRATSAKWDVSGGTTSTGRWRAAIDPDLLEINIRRVTPPPITETREAIDATETVWDHARTNTQAGISVDDVLYCGRETVLVTVAAAGATSITVTRGYGGSTAESHALGADILTVPPCLTGRRVTIYRTPRSGGADTDETITYAGYANSEPAWGVDGLCSIEIVDHFADASVAEDPITAGVIATDGTLGLLFPSVHPCAGATDGGYWLIDGSVVEMPYASGSWGRWRSGIWRWGPQPGESTSQEIDGLATHLICSNTAWPYPGFRYWESSSWAATDNPALVALCILLSIDSSNYDAGDDRRYDQGDYTTTPGGLYPGYALGVDRSLVDVAAFEDAAFGDLASVHASSLWMGYALESVTDIMRRLFAPLGYVCGTNRDGVWTLIRLQDVYPGDDATTINGSVNASEMTSQIVGRALDRIEIHCDPGPDGEGASRVNITEETGREIYPRHVGAVESYAASPYPIDAYSDADTDAYALMQQRVRLLGHRYLLVTLAVGPDLYDEIDIGSAVEIFEPGLFGPEDGQRKSYTDQVYGLVTSIRADSYTRSARLEVMITSGRNLALHSPSATVASYTGTTITVTEHDYTHDGDGDGARFVAGDIIIVCDSHLAARSTACTVTAVTDTTITVASCSVTPAAGDVVVYADYDAIAAQQVGTYAYCADGGAAGVTMTLGAAGDDPYEYGG